jgi:Coenzyme PQQ synthesis protein D (PqqD)
MEQPIEVLQLKDADIVWRSVDDEIVILHRGDWQYLTVNEAGTLLWSRLVEGATRKELASLLVSEYGIEDSRAAADVESFLNLLSEHDLLVLREGNGR